MTDQHANLLRQRGEFFGFPKCCIEFFVTKWFDLVTRSPLAVQPYRNLIRRFGFQPGYIPCPECLDHPNRTRGEAK